MRRWRGHVLFWLVLLGGLSADLLSKHYVFRFLLGRTDGVREFDVWPGVFRLSMHLNPGGPFSILPGHTVWLIGISVVAIGVILYLYLTMAAHGGRIGLVSLAMIAGGALGNLVDRLWLECVRDFLDFYVIHYPVFNVADVLITLGAGLLVLELLRKDTPAARAST